jgi:ankyrin repeat protein
MLGHRSSYLISARFRWVFCQLAVLQHCLTASIRETLDQLPETLDETYARVLSQIPPVNQAHAHRMLQCLMVAVRPLRVEELAELLAFEFGTSQGAIPKYRADWRPNDQVEAVLSTCSSLITIVDDDGSQVVQFSHFSVKEFLMSDRLTSSFGNFSRYQINPGPAHAILAQACLGFLLHLDGHNDQEIVKGFPLAEYAAGYWVAHAQFEGVASHVKDGMESLFDCDKPHFAAWVGIYNIDEGSYWESPSKMPTPLYYSSLCGFSDLVEQLAVKHPQHVNAIGGYDNFPLLAALAGKHIKVAEILLRHGADVDLRGRQERTPLHEAIRDVGMVQSLLNKGTDINCRQDDLRTPLHLAAYHGELEVARVLVEHKADADSRDNEGKTPLYLLLEGGHNEGDILDLARSLLEHCTDVNIRTTDGWTLLHAAAVWGRLEVARLLLDNGANPNAVNKDGETPLNLVPRGTYNSQEHGVSITRLFLERGVDVNARSKANVTPLHSAAFKGSLEITRVLLDHDANANAEVEWGETALHLVSRCEYDRGANPIVEDERGATPLHSVSAGKYDSQEPGVNIARLLLERGVDVNARSKVKFTPLHTAAFNGRLQISQVRFL